jgi:hypothetical protein
MEANIRTVLRQTIEVEEHLRGSNHVKGVLVLDHRGLVIASQGEGTAELGGSATNISALAGRIEPEEENPVVLVEAGVRKYLIKKEDQVTVVIVKEL